MSIQEQRRTMAAAKSGVARRSVARLLIVMVAPLILAGSLIDISRGVAATRIRFNRSEEPSDEWLHHAYEHAMSPEELFHLESIGALTEQHVHAARISADLHPPSEFRYNSSNLVKISATLRWFIALQERAALHEYDDGERAVLAARGPQVDQTMCGQHLDYMWHMIRKHVRSQSAVTDRATYALAFATDRPHLGLFENNNLFVGSYRDCLWNKLGVYRHELHDMNMSTRDIDAYFETRRSVRLEREQAAAASAGWLWRTWRALGPYVMPFAAMSSGPPVVSLREYSYDLEQLQMRYCMVKMRFPEWSNSTFDRRNMAFRVATCLPETCDSSSLEHHQDKIKRLIDWHLTPFFANHYLDGLYCLPDESSTMRQPMKHTNAWLFAYFNLAWLIITLAVLVFKLDNQAGGDARARSTASAMLQGVAQSWSLARNWADFVSSSSGSMPNMRKKDTGADGADAGGPGDAHDDEQAVSSSCDERKRQRHSSGTAMTRIDLKPLEGVKWLSSIGVIVAHGTMAVLDNNHNAQKSHEVISESWIKTVTYLGPCVVDYFFVVTGLITALSLLRLRPRKQIFTFKFWAQFVAYRYVRLIPFYLFIHWFISSWFRFLGHGPIWDYGTSATGWQRMCMQESWWFILIPRANTVAPNHHCHGVGWYIANDVQFAVLTPLIMLPLIAWPRHIALSGLGTVCAGIMASHISYFYHMDVDPRPAIDVSLMALTRVTDERVHGYVLPTYRCVAYLIGLGAGYLLYERERLGGGSRAESSRRTCVAKLFVAIVAYFTLAGPHIITTFVPRVNTPTMRLAVATLHGSLHTVTSLSAATLFVLLCTGRMRPLATLLRARFFVVMAKSLMSPLLLHLPLIYYHSHKVTYVPQVSVYEHFKANFIWCLESYLIGIVVHVYFELPIKKFFIKILLLAFGAYKVPSLIASDVKSKSSTGRKKNL